MLTYVTYLAALVSVVYYFSAFYYIIVMYEFSVYENNSQMESHVKFRCGLL